MLVHRGVPRQRGRGLGMLGGLAIKMLPKLLMGPGLGLAGSILPGLLNHGQRGSGFKDVAKNVMEKGGRRMLQAVTCRSRRRRKAEKHQRRFDSSR